MFIVLYSCVWSSHVLAFGFLVYRIFSHCIWGEERVRMTVGECNSTCQRNICHKGITALWSDSQWKESSLLSMEGFAWEFPLKMLTLRVHMQHNLIHPLILGIIFAAKRCGQTKIHNFDQNFHTVSTEDIAKMDSLQFWTLFKIQNIIAEFPITLAT